MSSILARQPDVFELALYHCRKDEWHQGLAYLRKTAELTPEKERPSLYFSYLGQALARCERRFDDALDLCDRALELEFFHPEHYLNLANVHALRHDRKRAIRVLERGLEREPPHGGLRSFREKLGVPQDPVLSV
ncbi:MAG: hypothetical protein AAF533_30745, partial [Acidobacteriota bacterium]